ncbi:MAG: putative membrane protein [Crocinitomix sp.]|jgi:putative membrane protein
MFIQRRISLRSMLIWTRKDIIFYFIVSTYPVSLYYFLGWDWLTIPTLPISLVGTIVAFNLGFKNNNAYDRLWEARKIWGGIVNSSRSWGIGSIDFVTNHFRETGLEETEIKAIHKRLIYRHIAWLTALRYQLRSEKPWEHHKHKDQIKFRERFHMTVEHKEDLAEEINPFLSAEEKKDTLSRPNPAAHIIKLQSSDLRRLHASHLLDDFRHMEMSQLLNEFYTLQGKSERIKNFPLPRQYATMSYYFVMLFIYILPFGMLSVFSEYAATINPNFIWLTIPACMIVSWVYFTLEKIGDYSENPFEGTGNDIPITSMSRGIEINLRDMLDEKDLPKPISAQNNVST